MTLDARALLLATMTEKEWLEQVRSWARQGGWLAYHPHRSAFSEPGWPDLVLCKPPEIIFAELKTEKGKLTVRQQEWIEALSNCATNDLVRVCVWRPSDADAVRTVLLGARV